MRATTRNVLLVGLALTLGHAGYRYLTVWRNAAVALTTREVPFEMDLASVGIEPTGCGILVFFSSTCPFCQAAAAEEASRPELGLPVTWIGETTEEVQAFASQPHPNAELVSSTDAFPAFGVQGVPTAFLVSGSQAVDVWGYKGTEDHEELAASCSPGPQ